MTPTSDTAPTDVLRRAEIESWLDDRHVTWDFDPTLALDAVDQTASLANQARLEPIDPEVVERYTADMRRGDQFPPIVVLRRLRKGHVIIGGNHRWHAAKAAGLDHLPAYLVDAEGEMVLRLTYEDNRRHGLPPTQAERVAQAVHLVDNGWTAKAAAACVGVTEPAISRERTIRKADRRAHALSVDRSFHALPKATRYALGSLRSDPVFAEASKLALDAHMSAAEAQRLVKAIDSTGSDVDAMTLIGSEIEEHRSRIQKGAGGKSTKATARAALSRALWGVLGCEVAEVVASTPNADVARTVRKQMRDAVEHLDRIQKALPR